MLYISLLVRCSIEYYKAIGFAQAGLHLNRSVCTLFLLNLDSDSNRFDSTLMVITYSNRQIKVSKKARVFEALTELIAEWTNIFFHPVQSDIRQWAQRAWHYRILSPAFVLTGWIGVWGECRKLRWRGNVTTRGICGGGIHWISSFGLFMMQTTHTEWETSTPRV